jgi:hypothetical protein
VCSSCCRSSAPWCRSRLSRSSSTRSRSWTTSCSCDDHLHRHSCSSSRWITRNCSGRRSLQQSLRPFLDSLSSSIVARPCTCSCACSSGHASTGTCHPSLTRACIHPCLDLLIAVSDEVSRLAALEACPRVPPHIRPGSLTTSQTSSSATPARPLQAHRTPHLA